ncbi:DUF2397 family protein [Streptomyces sp. NPDC048637]|uniref:DUF2397 family protein n=1 Tax=Streptomyces sp. NPDC048637 TaxID=3155636 RepID=UPI00342A2138
MSPILPPVGNRARPSFPAAGFPFAPALSDRSASLGCVSVQSSPNSGGKSSASPPQPFAYLQAPNAALYSRVLDVFAEARERFIVHLRPEDVAAPPRMKGANPAC